MDHAITEDVGHIKFNDSRSVASRTTAISKKELNSSKRYVVSRRRYKYINVSMKLEKSFVSTNVSDNLERRRNRFLAGTTESKDIWRAVV